MIQNEVILTQFGSLLGQKLHVVRPVGMGRRSLDLRRRPWGAPAGPMAELRVVFGRGLVDFGPVKTGRIFDQNLIKLINFWSRQGGSSGLA